MATEPTPDEQARLAERAKRIWGENPFSPENMAQDAAMKAPEREGLRADQRHKNINDLKWYEGEEQ